MGCLYKGVHGGLLSRVGLQQLVPSQFTSTAVCNDWWKCDAEEALTGPEGRLPPTADPSPA